MCKPKSGSVWIEYGRLRPCGQQLCKKRVFVKLGRECGSLILDRVLEVWTGASRKV